MMRYIWRIPLLALHVLVGIPLALVAFVPGIRDIQAGGGERLQARVHRLWSRLMLRIFGIRLVLLGTLPVGPSLVVANHISWLDIVMLHAVYPVCFVSKAEIRRWPVVGFLATVAGTIYIHRGSHASRQRANRRLAARLKRGDTVAIFPEGGITPGYGVGRFHGRLLAAAIRTGAPVVPVAIRYARERDVYEEITLADQTFFGNLLRLLGQRPLRGEVMIGAPIGSTAARRNDLARKAQRVVVEFYGAEKQSPPSRAKGG